MTTPLQQLRNARMTQDIKDVLQSESNDIKKAIFKTRRNDENDPPAKVVKVHEMLKAGGYYANCSKGEKKAVEAYINQ